MSKYRWRRSRPGEPPDSDVAYTPEGWLLSDQIEPGLTVSEPRHTIWQVRESLVGPIVAQGSELDTFHAQIKMGHVISALRQRG